MSSEVVQASAANGGLLVALAAVQPGIVVAEACLGAGDAVKGASEAAEVLWRDAAGDWLRLPRFRRPMPPRPHPRPSTEGLRRAGAGELLWVSEDRRRARHLDETGNEQLEGKERKGKCCKDAGRPNWHSASHCGQSRCILRGKDRVAKRTHMYIIHL